MSTVKIHAERALGVQDASNPRGVMLAWHKAMCDLWDDKVALACINVLYMGKMASLLNMDAESIGDATVHGSAGDVTFRQALQWAQDKIGGEP